VKNHQTQIETATYLQIGAIIELSKKPLSGFEDQRHHRAPSFSSNNFNYLWPATLFCLSIRLSICEIPKALATSAARRSTYRWCICTELLPLAFMATSTAMPCLAVDSREHTGLRWCRRKRKLMDVDGDVRLNGFTSFSGNPFPKETAPPRGSCQYSLV
jgi:hypothetical protein